MGLGGFWPIWLLFGCESTTSPDDGHGLTGELAYVRSSSSMEDYEVALMDLRNGKRRVWSVGDSAIGHLAWHPVTGELYGSESATTSGPLRISSFELQAGKDLATVSKIVDEPGRTSFGLTFEPDGTRIAYHSYGPGARAVTLMTRTLASGESTEIPCGYNACAQPDWHPDGTHLVFVADKKRVVERNLETGEQRELYKTPWNEDAVGPKYSPDGESLVLVKGDFGRSAVSQSTDLLRIPRDGGDAEVLRHVEDGRLSDATWIDSNHVVVGRSSTKTRTYRLMLYDLEDGSEQALSLDSVFAYGPAYKPPAP